MLTYRRFIITFLSVGLLIVASLFAFIITLDPYGTRVKAGKQPVPLMDLNQRYMYPQLVRSRMYNSAIFGTSTVRLIDPQKLNTPLQGQYANLAMNAATPWEQMQLAQLFVKSTPNIEHVIWGIDPTWCHPQADQEAQKRTFRPFPPWLYDDNPWNDVWGQFNFTALEVSVRLANYRLGRAKERIRSDGYEVFTPPEHTYDLNRARTHLWGATSHNEQEKIRDLWRNGVQKLDQLDSSDHNIIRPALGWMRSWLETIPSSTRITFVFAPVHISAQPTPNSKEAAQEKLCKQQFAALLKSRERSNIIANIIDWRTKSDIVLKDENYWDPLHYRLHIADELTQEIINKSQ